MQLVLRTYYFEFFDCVAWIGVGSVESGKSSHGQHSVDFRYLCLWSGKGMKEGIYNWSANGSPAVYDSVRNGKGRFEKYGAWEPVRLMFLRNISVSRLYVRANKAEEKNIASWKDLEGEKFYPGMPGTRDMERIMSVNELLGTNVKFVPGALADAKNLLKEARITGLLKSSPAHNFDAGMIEVHQSAPLTVVGFSKEEAEKIQNSNPMNTFMKTPKGNIKPLPDVGDFWEMNSAVMSMSSSQMSQEIGYRIAKAVHKGWTDICEAFPASKGVDPIKDALANTPASGEFYFHAGLIQYAKEIGIDVPARLIPPEYKNVK
jgi:TRAP-type uncharacterized transport system substrate-binding protein